MKQTQKKQKINASGIWLTVALLVILILASTVLLASFIKGYVAGEKNVISLIADGAAMGGQYDDKQFPAGAQPDMEASWETETSVDLFKNAYTGPDGTVTVESANAEKVIAPGTGNIYEFTLKNTGNISLDYTLSLKGVFRLADKELPLFVRLRQGNRWIIGGENRWIPVEEMNTLTDSNTVPRGETAVYRFEWQWPYEADEETQAVLKDFADSMLAADQADTELGNFAAEMQTDFHLDISVTSVITPGAAAEFDDGSSVLLRFLLVCTMGVLVLGSGLWLIILLVLRRRFYFTGLTVPGVRGSVYLDKKEAELADGRFTFPKTALGKHTLTLNEEAPLTLRFRRDKDTQGVAVIHQEDGTLVCLGKKIRAVELYVSGLSGGAAVYADTWAAIDKEHNVYTQAGVVPPVDKKNRTPGGLSVDEDGNFQAEELAAHV